MVKKVTVAIATYNMAGFLRDAIDSALAQDYPNLEVLVIDDGSTDETREVVKSFGRRVRYHHQDNGGVATALNKALELARGEFVHLLDADDILTQGSVRRLADLLDRYPSAGMAHADAIVIDSGGNVTGERRAPGSFAGRHVIPSPEIFKQLLHGCHITTSAVMLRKTTMKKVAPFRQKAVPGEDWDMWLRIAATSDVAHIPFLACYYRVHGSSITSAYDVKSVLRSHLYTLDTIFGDPTFRYQELRDYAYACLSRTVARVAARSRDRSEFARELRDAILRKPGIAFEGDTLRVVGEGLKALIPAPLLNAGKRMRRGLVDRVAAL
jgi:glycosyltransferase involved in cell wall biosynthesis